MSTPQAFLLLALPNVLLTSGAFSQRDTLALECLTVPDAPTERDVFLVLRLGAFEAAVDPARHVSLALSPTGERTYTFHRTASEAAEIVLQVPPAGEKRTHASADVDTFDGILEQYANFRHGDGHVGPTPDGAAFELQDAKEDLRGRLVLVDNDNGEVLGTVGGDSSHIHAEASVTQPGHEHDPVYIEVGPDGEIDAHELFVRAIPPGEHNFITRSASVLSTGIAGAANLLSNGMTSASNYYIARAVPHPSASPPADGRPPVPPPRAVEWLTSTQAQKGMKTAHTYTGKAVVVSGKTISAVEGMIRRAVGGAQAAGDRYSKGKGRAETGQASPGPSPRGSPRPPAYNPPRMVMEDPNYPSSKEFYGEPASTTTALPPRYSATPPPIPARKGDVSPRPPPSPGRDDKLNTKDRIVLSANLVFGTLGKSAKQVMDVGSDRLSAVVGHKYGAEAATSARLLTGTVRNVGLVYVDVTGLGRRALLKTAGKEYVKAAIKGRKFKLKTNANGEVIQAEPATPGLK